LNAVKASKVQISRLVSYCGLIIVGLLILVGILTNDLPAQLRLLTLTVPVPFGIILGVLLYYRTGHETLQYDETGFSLRRGRGIAESHAWTEFVDVSLCADQKGGVNVRLYREPDGEYIEIPASKTGVDAFSLRNRAMERIRRK
jgi:hypothetical protein